MAELADISDPADREEMLLRRGRELADVADEIGRSSRIALGKDLASWSLGIAGGVWSAVSGDPVGLALTAAGVIAGSIPGAGGTVSAYSYVFAVNKAFGVPRSM